MKRKTEREKFCVWWQRHMTDVPARSRYIWARRAWFAAKRQAARERKR